LKHRLSQLDIFSKVLFTLERDANMFCFEF